MHLTSALANPVRPWYLRDPERLRTELLAGKAVGLRLLMQPEEMLTWQGSVEVQGKQHELTIAYPASFPMTPPLVVETDRSTGKLVDDRHTHHQMLDGSLCLYTHGQGSRSWSHEHTVTDVLERYREYREMANAGTHANELDLAGIAVPCTLIMTPEQADLMNTPGGHGRAHIVYGLLGQLGVIVEVHARDKRAEQALEPYAACGVMHLGTANDNKSEWWLRISDTSWPCLRTCADLDALIMRSMLRLQAKKAKAAPVVILARGDARQSGNVLAVIRANMPALPLPACPVQVLDLEERLFARVDGALSGRKQLAPGRVALVGVGSLGSEVAMHLARSGVSEIHLFDYERLEPENVVRHAGDLAGLFRPKVDVVAELIIRRNPFATVKRHRTGIMWATQDPGSEALCALLEDPATLVVVTVADDRVERAINQMAVLRDAPVIYGSVLGAAEHGRIFRVIPGTTACYQCVLDSQSAEPERYPSLAGDQGNELPGVGAYRQPGIPGLGLDISQIAILIARLALQTLAEQLTVTLGYPHAQGDHFLWTSRGGWAFDHPLQVRVEHYPQRPECPVCGVGRKNAAVDGQLPADIAALIQQLLQ